MNFFSRIRSWFIWATNVLVDWALFFYDLGGIGDWIGDLCRDLSDFTSEVAGYLWYAADWWDEVEDAISDILSWSNIRSLIRDWLYRIEDVLDWWYSWTTWIGQEIEDWWLGVRTLVQGWIDIATQGFDELRAAWDTFWNVTWPTLLGNVNELRSLWDNFWTTIFPNLVDFTWLETWWNTKLPEITGIIATFLKEYEPFWEGWQDWRDSVAEFFADPLEWLYNKMDEFFERFW